MATSFALARASGVGARRAHRTRRVLLIGHGPLASRIRAEVERSRRYSIAGVLVPPSPLGAAVAHGLEGEWLASSFRRLMDEVRPHEIVVALAERRGQLPTDALLEARTAGTPVIDGVQFFEDLARKVAIENLKPSNLIFCPELTKSPLRLFVHRAVSLLVAGAGLLVTAPVMALVALLVKLESRGPVFFVQPRVGLRGRVFRLLKFRTMRGERGEGDDVWHRHDEPRITPLGRLLRKTHLDELPQFFNILKGDMNLVGPRPEMAENLGAMSQQIPYYVVRHSVRPGVTGWAQVRQGYAVSYDEVLEKTCYDLYYIKKMSLLFDLRILLETARTLLTGSGAR